MKSDASLGIFDLAEQNPETIKAKLKATTT